MALNNRKHILCMSAPVPKAATSFLLAWNKLLAQASSGVQESHNGRNHRFARKILFVRNLGRIEDSSVSRVVRCSSIIDSRVPLSR